MGNCVPELETYLFMKHNALNQIEEVHEDIYAKFTLSKRCKKLKNFVNRFGDKRLLLSRAYAILIAEKTLN